MKQLFDKCDIDHWNETIGFSSRKIYPYYRVKIVGQNSDYYRNAKSLIKRHYNLKANNQEDISFWERYSNEITYRPSIQINQWLTNMSLDDYNKKIHDIIGKPNMTQIIKGGKTFDVWLINGYIIKASESREQIEIRLISFIY